MEETAFNPKRRLCPDGSCVGVLGADGRCSVCRRTAGAGDESLAESFTESPDEARAEVSADDAPATERANGATVGADGVCGTCGQKAQ